MTDSVVCIQPFQWAHWHALWELRAVQLGEMGIWLDPLPDQPDLNSPDEQDYHRINQVYLSGGGNFWIAWAASKPVGHIGAQRIEDVVELRRMYVRPEYRRRGVATRLVQTLIDYCASQGIETIELWTAKGGAGRVLYESFRFQVVAEPGRQFSIAVRSEGEIRMRLELNRSGGRQGA